MCACWKTPHVCLKTHILRPTKLLLRKNKINLSNLINAVEPKPYQNYLSHPVLLCCYPNFDFLLQIIFIYLILFSFAFHSYSFILTLLFTHIYSFYLYLYFNIFLLSYLILLSEPCTIKIVDHCCQMDLN